MTPYQIIRFPMKVAQSFQQFNRTEIDFGSDIDGDGTNEHVDVEGLSTVMGQESITVPAGTYPDAVRVEARMTLKIRLSSVDRTAVGTDVMTAWFAKGVGLVKYIERQELAALGRPWEHHGHHRGTGRGQREVGTGPTGSARIRAGGFVR